jgi:hypothetical protein
MEVFFEFLDEFRAADHLLHDETEAHTPTEAEEPLAPVSSLN